MVHLLQNATMGNTLGGRIVPGIQWRQEAGCFGAVPIGSIASRR